MTLGYFSTVMKAVLWFLRPSNLLNMIFLPVKFQVDSVFTFSVFQKD